MLIPIKKIQAGDFWMHFRRREKLNMDKDIREKNCLSDNERYADLINGLLIEGDGSIQDRFKTDL